MVAFTSKKALLTVGHPDRAGRRLLGACSFFLGLPLFIYLFIYLSHQFGVRPVEYRPRLLRTEKSWVNPNLRRKGPKRVSGSGGVV